MADVKRVNFITPVGRLVQGDPKTGFGQTHDRKTRQRFTDDEGNPITKYYLALAIPKTTVGTHSYDNKGNLILGNPNELIAMLREEGRKGFPNLFDAAGNCTRRDFAFKYIDGDSTEFNQDNKRWCDLEGFAGNWVFKFNTLVAIPMYDMQNNKIDPANNPILRGHWIRVWGNINTGKSAKAQAKPSVFLNPGAVIHVAYGQEIVGFDTSEVFSGVGQTPLPPGASITPMASSNVPSGMPQAPAPQIPQYGAPISQYAPPSVPTMGSTVQPAPSFLNPPQGAVSPQAAPAPAPAPAPVPAPAPAPAPVTMYQCTNGCLYTHDQLIGYGFTIDQIAALPKKQA